MKSKKLEFKDTCKEKFIILGFAIIFTPGLIIFFASQILRTLFLRHYPLKNHFKYFQKCIHFLIRTNNYYLRNNLTCSKSLCLSI